MLALRILSALLLALASTLAGKSPAGAPDYCTGAGREFADREYFALCHSSTHRAALWAGYELKAEHLERVARRGRRTFAPIAGLPARR